MNRVMVLGCCGAGKSTFARALHSVTGLDLIHLDQHYWKPGWQETGKEDWAHTVRTLAAKPRWIIDGNYGGTMNIRLQRADTIIYLDYPTWLCLWRVVLRVLKNRGRERPDMPKGCPERFDPEFFHYVATFNLTRRKKLMEKLSSLAMEKQIFIFTHDLQARHFLEKIQNIQNGQG